MVFAALALLLAVVGLSGWAQQRQETLRAHARHALQIGQSVARLELLLQDAETGQRGYLITLRESYLAPYLKAASGVPGELDTLSRLTAGSPQQAVAMTAIREDVTAKLGELAETIELARQGDKPGALGIVLGDTGKVVMDRIRATLDQLSSEEAAKLAGQQTVIDQSGHQVRYIIWAAAALIIVLGALIFVTFRRYTRELEASHVELQTNNAALVSEIATRKAIEGQLVQSQKMEAVGQLTGGIAHDFNNMLAVVISALTLLKRKLAKQEGPDNKDIEQFADAAIDGARRAAALTNRLLAYSRQQPLAPEVIDANRMVKNMSELLHRTLGEQIEIETVLAAGLWRTRADASQLENSIVNLAVNARDAMTGEGMTGGKITIETANVHLDDAYAAGNVGAAPGQHVLIAVSDTGPGMKPEVLARAFDPFFTTKPVGKGTGLGLSQVYGFVKQSGGHIKIYSEIGEGTVVKIYLPRSFATGDAPDVAKTEVVGALAPPVDPATVVLVVEDDAQVRVVTVASLRELGYVVIQAGRPSEALTLLQQQPRIDLMFTDVVMPEMSGRKLADEARKLRPEMKLLFTTGYTQNAIVHNGILDPGTELLMKPFSVEQLAGKVAAVLAG
jgi:signal transduction histidine kinase/CheY-like chemotaxis protein